MGQEVQVMRDEHQDRDRDRRTQRRDEPAGRSAHGEGPALAAVLAAPPLAQLRWQ